MEKIIWTDCVMKEEILRTVEEEGTILNILKRKNVDCIGHILRRNCLLKHVIEGNIERSIEMTERRGTKR
jgi:hypothetical protein